LTESSTHTSTPAPTHCVGCGYALTGLQFRDSRFVCPECGYSVTQEELELAAGRRRAIKDRVAPYIMLAAISLPLWAVFPTLGLISFLVGIIPIALHSAVRAASDQVARKTHTGPRFGWRHVRCIVLLELFAIGAAALWKWVVGSV